MAVPIYQTTSYQFQDAAHADRLFALDEIGHIYTRVSNPTQDAFETRLAALEGGAAALLLSSGQAATAYSILNLAGTGDNIVSSTDLYGGTWALFAASLKHFGVDVRFVDPADPENFRRATDATRRRWPNGLSTTSTRDSRSPTSASRCRPGCCTIILSASSSKSR